MPGTPSVRAIHNWTKKDPGFARQFSSARDFGEEMIREQYVELLRSPAAMAALAGGKKCRREFNRQFIRPIDLTSCGIMRTCRIRVRPTKKRHPQITAHRRFT